MTVVLLLSKVLWEKWCRVKLRNKCYETGAMVEVQAVNVKFLEALSREGSQKVKCRLKSCQRVQDPWLHSNSKLLTRRTKRDLQISHSKDHRQPRLIIRSRKTPHQKYPLPHWRGELLNPLKVEGKIYTKLKERSSSPYSKQARIPNSLQMPKKRPK